MYVLVVLVALWSSRRWYTYTAALVCSGLAILGFFSLRLGTCPVDGGQSAFALCLIWVTAILGLWRRRGEAA